MNPSVQTFRPTTQPTPIKGAVESRWSYGRFRVSKTTSNAGGVALISTGDIADAIGLSKVDFQVDRVAAWLLGPPDYQAAELTLTTAPTVLPNTIGFEVSDFGTPNRPAAVGIDLPRALTAITNGATASSTGTQFSLTQSGTGLSTSPPAKFVMDLWVLYRQSA